MQSATQDILSFPYWGRDKRQDPFTIPGAMVSHNLEDLSINLEPLRTDYNHNNIGLIMRPNVKQDTSQMTNAGDVPTYGVTNPGGLYAALLSSVPDLPPEMKGAAKHGP
jgi:hypothetical protein